MTIDGRGPIRSKALVLYEGTQTPHRSCGIALAETFGRPTQPYQSLRRGGITGHGTCGAIVAGQLLLGEFLGDPDPTGSVTPELKQAMQAYHQRIANELDRGPSPDLICNNMTAPHGPFRGPARHLFCTGVVGQVAQVLDEILQGVGHRVEASPITLADGTTFDPAHSHV
ncbi:MAG: C-GCAxxG-C-C family (seleno)protein [Nannocystaceae bacterium]